MKKVISLMLASAVTLCGAGTTTISNSHRENTNMKNHQISRVHAQPNCNYADCKQQDTEHNHEICPNELCTENKYHWHNQTLYMIQSTNDSVYSTPSIPLTDTNYIEQSTDAEITDYTTESCFVTNCLITGTHDHNETHKSSNSHKGNAENNQKQHTQHKKQH